MSKNVVLMRKIVALLVVTSISAINLTPFGVTALASHSFDQESILPKTTNNDDISNYHFFTDAYEKSEAEEKILLDFLQEHSKVSLRAGHLLNDFYSIPPERHYLLHEPPIA